MAGYEYVIATGIDGNISEWETLSLRKTESMVLRYNRHTPLLENLRVFKKYLAQRFTAEELQCVCIFGWSIGGGVALWLSQYFSFGRVVVANCFSDRASCLRKRDIIIGRPEYLNVANLDITNQTIWLIAGMRDTKIEFSQTLELEASLSCRNRVTVQLVPEGEHSILSLTTQVREALALNTKGINT